jgi:hypothetical protein
VASRRRPRRRPGSEPGWRRPAARRTRSPGGRGTTPRGPRRRRSRWPRRQACVAGPRAPRRRRAFPRPAVRRLDHRSGSRSGPTPTARARPALRRRRPGRCRATRTCPRPDQQTPAEPARVRVLDDDRDGDRAVRLDVRRDFVELRERLAAARRRRRGSRRRSGRPRTRRRPTPRSAPGPVGPTRVPARPGSSGRTSRIARRLTCSRRRSWWRPGSGCTCRTGRCCGSRRGRCR